MRYQCVSKLWSSITRLPSFINSFTTRSSARLLLTFEFHKKQLVFSFPQNKNTDGSYSPVYSYHMENTNHDRYLQWESVQGLILLRGLKIWNPSLRRVLTLTRPKEHIPTSFDIRKSYLGYDTLEGKHKVLSLYYGSNFVKPLILTLGAQESWRTVTKGIPMHSPTHVRGLRGCFNGVLYFQARVDDQHIIMSFDVKSESFMNPIKYPECSPFRWLHNMILYEGSLALFAHDFPFGTGELYILKDADGHKWTRQCLPGVSFKREWRNLMHFKGITDAGELVFAPGSFVDSFYILYFDPRRNSFREAFFKGFMDDEFRRSDDGVPNNHGTCINVFPNHMESLVSL
ncbi:putative F-box protein [Raphanus sativus]|nr:putative F-box protein [Raphanus sativus]KAJ4867894.1 putative F-box protein [Raphanus sativus]